MSHTLILFGLLALAVWGGRLTGARQRARLTAELARSEQQLWHALRIDPLTGLPNRTDAESVLAQMIASGKPFCVGFADLDRFKDLNDTLGHAVGDRALKHVAAILRTRLPGTQAWRLHGDEFVFAWPTTLDDGLASAQYLRHIIGSLPLHLPNGQLPPLSMSIGVAAPAPGSDVPLLLHHADLAMNDAKNRGTGCSTYDPRHAATTVEPRPAHRVRDRRHQPAAVAPALAEPAA
ncbi:GGDEF domain-containing protein [Catellatospora citrea]|uniref:GGDEF domain-containing protein n=1 Tax=Catellatospora citrea TaxID=53366 RepID=UPI003406C9BC